MRRALVVFLVVVTMFGVAMPRAEAYVATPPPPVMLPPTVTAPPAMGLCSTPLGVLICAGFVGAAIADGWTYDEEVDVRGLGYVEDGLGNRWEICEYTKSGEMRCAGDWSGGGSSWGGPAVKSEYENLEALKEYFFPGGDQDDYVSAMDHETTMIVPKHQSEYQEALAHGVEFVGGWAHWSEGRRQLTIEVFFETENPCPRVERDDEWLTQYALDRFYPEWVSCTGVTILGGRNMGASGAPSAGALTSPNKSTVTCSDGGVPIFSGYAGGEGTGVTVTCPAGTVIEGYDYNGNNEPDKGNNRHFRVPICFVGSGGFVDHFNNNCTDGATRPPLLMWITMTDDEVPSRRAVMHTWCRAEDGSLTLRTSYGPEVPVFIDEVRVPNPACEGGEVPVKWEAEVCETPSSGEDCVRAGSGEIPGIDEMTDAQLECVQRLASPDPCPMWLEKWNGSEWEYCDPAAANCVGWWNDPDREILYRCGWGGDYYSASQCVALKDFYDVEEGGDIGTQPEPGTDPDPDPTEIGTDRITITGPQNPVSARPNVPWWKRIIYEWSTGSTADMQGACWPQGWGLLNPLQWVLRPIMCALTWAFVPTTSVQARLENVRDAWEARTGLTPDIIPEVAGPVVGGTCGWGFDSVDTPALGVIPEVDIIWCPSEYGVTTQAAVMRGLGLGALGLMVVSMVMRWVSMGASHEGGLEEGFQGSVVS